MDPLTQWLGGIFISLVAELAKQATNSGASALGKVLEGAHGEEVNAIHAALPPALETLKRNDVNGHRFVAFLEQRQQARDTAFGDALLRALLVEPYGEISPPADLQSQIPPDLYPTALNFLALFHQQLWRQPPFEKILAAKAAQDELRVALEMLAALERLAPIPDYAAAKRVYLEHIIRNSDFIRPWIIALPQERPLKLDDVYVSLIVEREESERGLSDTRASKGKNTPINVAQAVKEHPRLVIKGDPGAGKSTLTRYLDLLFASAMWKQLHEKSAEIANVQDKQGNEYGQARLPIRIRIADFAEARKTNPTLSLDKFLPDAFEKSKIPPQVLERVFSNAMDEGNALVLLDGLDEVGGKSERDKIVEAIEEFVNANRRNRLVVTSRLAGYVPLAGFVPFVFRALEQEQIGLIAGFWYLGLYRAEREDAIKESDSIEDCLPRESMQVLLPQELHDSFRVDVEQFGSAFFGQVESNSGARRLIENPLTLTLLIELHLKGRPLAKNRSELYREILVNLLETWERRGGRIPDEKIILVDDAEEMLGPLGYWLHESKSNATRNGTASEREIKAKLKPWADANNVNVSTLWQRLAENTPLFMEFARGQFGFAHRTFQEYFVAKEMLRPENETLDLIYRHRHQPNWEEPILLAMSSVPDATELIRTAILAKTDEAKRRGFEASRYDDVLHRDFFYAVRCAADGARIGETLASEIEAQLIEWRRYAYDANPIIGWPHLTLQPLTKWEYFEGLHDAVRYLVDDLRNTEIGERIRARMKIVLNDKSLLESDDLSEVLFAYEVLRLLGQEYSPEIIKFYFRLAKSRDYGSRFWAGKVLEALAENKDKVVPSLFPIIEDKEDEELRVEAAIFLAEAGQTTPEAVRCLFATLNEDSKNEAPQSDQEELEYEVRERRRREKHRREETRERALKALSKIEKTAQEKQTPEVIAYLLSVIKDMDMQIRFIAATETGQELWRFLGNIYPHELRKLVAASLLVKLGKMDALDILQNAIIEPEGGKLLLGIWQRFGWLEKLDFNTLRAVLRDAICGSCENFGLSGERYTAVFAAKQLAALNQVPSNVVNYALALSERDDSQIRSFAIHLLSRLGTKSPEVYARLMDLAAVESNLDEEYKHYREQVREDAAEALYALGDIPAEYLPEILELIRKESSLKADRRIRWWCFKMLADRKISTPEETHREIAETLLDAFQIEESDSNAEEIEHALGYFAVSPEVMPLLIGALKSDQRLHAAGFYALANDFGRGRKINLSPEERGKRLFNECVEIPLPTIAVLLEAITDSNDWVNGRATGILAQSAHRPPELINGLLELLQHPDPWIRYRAMDVLLNLDYKERDIVPVWLDLVRSEDTEIRSRAIDLGGKLPLTLAEKTELDELEKMTHLHGISQTPGTEAFLKVLADKDSIARLFLLWHINAVDFTENQDFDQRLLFRIAASDRALVDELDALSAHLNDEEKKEIFGSDFEETINHVRRMAIWKIGEEGNLEKETIPLMASLLNDPSDEIQASAIRALAELFTRFPNSFAKEREEFGNQLYKIVKNEERGAGDAWGALWRIAPLINRSSALAN